jgi:predicted RNA-binding Zn-ribbon protein involved in translation (DUF1610 family)
MRAKGPKCQACGKKIQIMSYDSAYLKVVRPGESKALFVCWKCAEKIFGESLRRVTEKSEGASDE